MFSFEYRAAVALNNMATSMIEHGCYQQAVDTMKDAAVAMQTLAAPEEEKSEWQRQQPREMIKRMLDNAQYCKANPAVANHYVQVRVVSHDVAFRQAHLYLEKCHLVHCMIRIEAQELFLDEQDLHLPSAIILYNLALACFCQAKNDLTLEQAVKHQSNAITFLRYSLLLLKRRLETERVITLNLSSEVGVAVMVLQELVISLVVTGQMDDTVMCSREHADLSWTANALKVLHNSESSAPAPAA